MQEPGHLGPQDSQEPLDRRDLSQLALPRTRLQIPRLPTGLVPRGRLFDLLEAGVDRPVTVVTGPPGAGKTTLLAQWGHATSDSVAWVTCAAADRDPAVLWAVVVAALEAAGVAFGAEDARRGQRGSVPDPISVVNQIEKDGRRVSIVVDAADVAGEGLAVLRPLTDWLPAHGRLIVVSRGRTALSLSGLQVRGQLVEIDDAALRLTDQETAQVLEAQGLDEPPNIIDAIHKESEGWVASVVLTAQALKASGHDTTPAEAIVRMVPPALADFLRDEFMPSLGEQLGEFLLDVCVLDELTRESCAALVGPERARTALSELAGSGLPTEQLPARGVIRLHRQVRAVLLDMAIARDPDGPVRQHAKAAACFEASRDHPRAIQHYARAGEHVAAVSLVGASVFSGTYEDAMAAVASWLQEVDPEVVRSDPSGQTQVLAATGSLLAGELATARHWLIRAGTLPQPLDDRVRGQIAICHSALCLLEGDLSGVERHFEATEQDRGDWPLVWRVFQALVAARARLWSGRIESAEEVVAAVGREPDLDQHSEAAVLAMRAELAVATGEAVDAVDLADEAIQLLGHLDPAAADHALQDAYRARGLAHYEQGRLDAAEEDLLRTLRAAEPSRPAMAAVALAGLAQVHAARGHVGDALDTLVRGRSLVPEASPLWQAMTALEARIDLAVGDTARARHVVQSMSMGSRGVRRGLQVRLALADGDVDTAIAQLDDLPPPSTPRARLDHALLRTRIEHMRGRRKAARAALTGALDVAAPQRLVRPFFEDGTDLWPLLVPELGRRPRSIFATAVRAEYDRIARMTAGVDGVPHDVVARLATLTKREREILDDLASERTVREIAADLHISMNTIRTHTKSIYRKLGVASRAEATRALQ